MSTDIARDDIAPPGPSSCAQLAPSRALAAATVAATLVLAGCSAGGSPDETGAPSASDSADLIGSQCENYPESTAFGDLDVRAVYASKLAGPIRELAADNRLVNQAVNRAASRANRREAGITIVLPSAAAVAAIPPAARHSLRHDPDLLASLVRFGVLAGSLDTSTASGTLTTDVGLSVDWRATTSEAAIGRAQVVCGGWIFDGGALYVVDRVTVPPAS